MLKMMRLGSGHAMPLALTLLVWSQARHTSAASLLRSAGPAVRTASFLGSSQEVAIPSNEEIREKWAKMDDFVDIMFSLACQWKHGKDVHGRAAEEAKKRGLDSKQTSQLKDRLRNENVNQLFQACGSIEAKGKGACRQGCADHWGKALKERAECDRRCVAAYETFDKNCKAKAQGLEKVYAMKAKMAEARQRCYEGHCKEFPSAWMKADAAAAEEEVKSQCTGRCAADQIQKRCERRFQLEVDFIRVRVESGCFSNSTKAKTCFDSKKAEKSTDYDSCISTDEATCQTQYADCKSKGKVDSTFSEAEDFCHSRKKMCLKQVSVQCTKEHGRHLDEAKKHCEQESAADVEKCVDDTLAAKETEAVSTCKAELPAKCSKECHSSCDTEKMNKCLSNLASEHDPAEDFCQDFGRLFHEFSEV